MSTVRTPPETSARPRPVALELVLLGVGVLLTLLLSFLLLFALNLAAEALVSVPGTGGARHEPGGAGVPVDTVRTLFMVATVALYPLVLRSRLSELAKAVLLSAPVGVVAAGLAVGFWAQPTLAVAALLVVGGVTALLLRAYRAPWTYWASAALALLLALAYAAPRF